ncbi:MAG: LysR family transcriptional regulator [Acidimicrobiales bacterium]
MARPEWLRTFLAVYRSGSITDAARLRSLSQPAASQQLAALERAVGTSLFVRSPAGVLPTERGRSLYGEVAAAMDQLEAVLAGLDAGRVGEAQPPPLRFGSSAEYFAAALMPRLLALDLPVVARFAPDGELIEHLERGELDVVVTSGTPARRSVVSVPVGEKRFVLVGPPGIAPKGFGSLETLGSWLRERPWVAYSRELPITRRFWQVHLGGPFPSQNLRVVAPDLRAVASAVAGGIGCSLLPAFVCADSLAEARMVEVHPVADLVAPEPWSVSFRDGESSRPAVARLVGALEDQSPR